MNIFDSDDDDLRRDVQLMRDRDIWVGLLAMEQDPDKIIRITELIAEIDRKFDEFNTEEME